MSPRSLRRGARLLPVPALAVLALLPTAGPAAAQDAGPDPLPVDALLDIGAAVGGEAPRWHPGGRDILYASPPAGGLATISTEGGAPLRIPLGVGEAGHFLASQSPRWSPDGRWISYVSTKGGSPEIWLYSMEAGEERQLTRAGGRLVGSYSWAPDGSAVAFASDRYGDMDVWRVEVADGRQTRLTTSEAYEVYPSWTPDGRELLFVRLDDTWTEHTVVRISADGGGERVVLRDDGFFDYGAGEDFGYPLVSPDGGTVLFRSHRSGWLGYWLQPLDGGEPAQLAPQEADQSGATWSPDGSRVALVTNRNGTRSLTVVDVATREARTVAAPDGMGVLGHPAWSPDGTRLSYTLETPTRPRELRVVDVETGASRRITPDPPGARHLDRLVAPEKVAYESTDGHTIHAYLYAPRDRSPERPVPGLLWIHGGPTSQWEDTYQPDVQYLVQRGYAVLMPNIRGSSGYGKAFEDANNRCWGHCDLEDVRAGAGYLGGLPYVDGESMGITGTSYGGIMTLSAIAFAPGLFQAAVSRSGYGDWVAFVEDEHNELRHRKLLEYELGPFPEARDVYRHVSPIRAAAEVRTPVFLLHGEGRYPGSPQSLDFAGALQEHYKVFRYEAYPGETYYVAGRENRRRLLQDVEAFFDFYLKGEARTLPGRSWVPEG